VWKSRCVSTPRITATPVVLSDLSAPIIVTSQQLLSLSPSASTR
jgi:hypothetical protein